MNKLYPIISVIVIVAGISVYWFTQSPQQKVEPQILTTGRTLVPWKADGTINVTGSVTEYSYMLDYGNGKYVIYWRNDGEYLYVALKGRTNGWVAIGFEPTSRMRDADMVFGWVKDGNVTVLDLFSVGETGPHPPDIELGGTHDILEYGGKEEGGYTAIEFKRKLNTGDRYDKAFTRGQQIKIIWSFALVDDFGTKHDDRGSGELKLD